MSFLDRLLGNDDATLSDKDIEQDMLKDSTRLISNWFNNSIELLIYIYVKFRF